MGDERWIIGGILLVGIGALVVAVLLIWMNDDVASSDNLAWYFLAGMVAAIIGGSLR